MSGDRSTGGQGPRSDRDQRAQLGEDTHVHGMGNIRFNARLKSVTTCWPERSSPTGSPRCTSPRATAVSGAAHGADLSPTPRLSGPMGTAQDGGSGSAAAMTTASGRSARNVSAMTEATSAETWYP
jgi:hypothetical protein